jgi:hypothetical protein
MQPISYELQSRLENELEPGEKIFWSQAPVPRWFTAASIAQFLFAIPWTAFSLFWIWGAAGFKWPDFSGPMSFFPLFGVPFFLIGLGLLSSPYWHYRRMKNTLYAVTDRRALVLQGGWNIHIRSFQPSMIRELDRRERRDGTGDIIFSSAMPVMVNRSNQTMTPNGFFSIEDPKTAEGFLRALAQKPGAN